MADTELLERPKTKAYVMDDENIKAAFIQAIEKAPKSRRMELLNLVNEFVENAKRQPKKPLPTNKDELEAAEIKLYPTFKKDTGSTDGLECLEQYKPWLRKYTKSLDRDYMCQADLGRLDPKLLSRLRKLYKAEELKEYIPNEAGLNKQIALTIPEKEKKELTKKLNIIYRHIEAA